MVQKWMSALLRCSGLKLFTWEQAAAIEEDLRESPDKQKIAEGYIGDWTSDLFETQEEPPSMAVEYFGLLLGHKRRAAEGDRSALRNVKPLSISEQLMPNLDMAYLRIVAVPSASDYNLGRFSSPLVEWSSGWLNLKEESSPMLQQWWEENVLCEDVILQDGSHKNILEQLKQKHLKVYAVDERKEKEVVRRQYRSFMGVVEACMEEILRRLGIECTLSVTCDQQLNLPSPQPPDGLLCKDGEPWIHAEGKTHVEDAAVLDHKIAEARGELVRLANQRFLAEYFARQASRGSYPDWQLSTTVRGFTFTGKYVQAVVLTHFVVRKPKGLATPLAPLLGASVAGECYELDVNSKGMEVILQQCLLEAFNEVKMRARAEEAESYWRQGKLVAVKENRGFMIGDELLDVTGKRSGSEMKVAVKSVVRATPTSIVVSVLWKDETWWLKLGANRTERRWEMARPDCYWEAWFQVERDALCHRLVGSDLVVIPVEVQGVDRPAVLIQDAGVSLAEMKDSITPSQVSEMSKQIFETLVNKARGVFHNDIAPRNICFKDGTYRLIDWGFACGPKLGCLESAVGRAWKEVSLVVPMPPVLDWKLCADCCLFHVPPREVRDSVEGLFYCCLELLNENLPWSDAAAAEHWPQVVYHRCETKAGVRKNRSFMNASFIFQPVLDHALNGPDAPKCDGKASHREAWKETSGSAEAFDRGLPEGWQTSIEREP